MRQRTVSAIGAAVLALATAAAHLTAQAPSAPSRNRRVWTGTIDDREVLLNAHDSTPIRRPVQYFKNVQVSFTFVSEDDPDRRGFTRWVSRQLTWNAHARSASAIEGRECRGSGSLDLGPADAYDATTPEQDAQLKIPCRDWDAPNVWAFIPLPNPKVHLPIIDVTMTNCEPTRRWSHDTVRYTLSVSPTETRASFKFAYFDAEHPPVPGAKFKIWGESNVLGRWRFVVESSRLRGYATNADISSTFFDLYPGALSMRGNYGTLDPDLVFDPAQSAERGSEWKPPSPDRGPRKWSVIESTDQTSVNRVEAELTAMDFGAYGEVRAYISPTCGGGWMPVAMQHGGSVARYPKDDDNNFMSDLAPDYRGLAPTSDDDGTPKGDGAGDGFTAFEEYRGFVVPILTTCRSPLQRKHVRTSPTQKNLFVHVSDPMLGLSAVGFGVTSGLRVLGICPQEYVDDDTRIVNFTMHTFPGQLVIGEGFRGARLTQAEPQHGLHLTNQPIGGGVLGESIPLDRAVSVVGPPKHIKRVAVDLPAIRATYGMSRFHQLMTIITHHELGHAVGIRHHGDRNIVGPIALLTIPSCIVGMIEGTVDGHPVCSATGIALQGQQNSGNASCPMKYLHWSWYVPRPSALIYSRMVDFRPNVSWNWQRNERPARLEGYEGPVYRYRKDLDEPPDHLTMAFCTAATGTGINALPGDQNHAGDSQRRPSCSEQLRVRDMGR